MSDDKTAGGGGAPGAQDSARTQQQTRPPLIISAQYVRDLSFESPHAPGIFTEMRQPPEIAVNVDVQANALNEQQGAYEVRLKVNAEGKVGDKTAFITELDYGAVVMINAPAEQVSPLLLIEAPRHIFPFARNVLADITRDGGFPPVVLQPLDFVELFRRRVAAMQQARQQEQGQPSASDPAQGSA